MMKLESPVTSIPAAQSKPPLLEKQRGAENDPKPRSSIIDVNERMTANVTRQVSEVVTSKTSVQEKKN